MSEIVKYKIYHLHEGATELDASVPVGIWECAHPKDVESKIAEKFTEGWVYVQKRSRGDWGWELFFRKKR